jgi:acyl-CoA synthetase (AMP-forming)/AMP-acid ligase II
MLSSVFHDVEAQSELIAQAQRVAALVGPASLVVVSCRHAQSFVPALLGAWTAGATVELLPNVQPGTLDRVDADREIAHVLHDDPALQTRSPKAIFIPTALQSPTSASPPLAAWPQVAVRMTTSGTTERPRYIEKTWAQLRDEVDVLATTIPFARCVLSTVPLSHLYGLLWGVLLPLRFGARIVSHGALMPADIAATIERESVDLMVSTPAHLRAMADATMPRGLRVISSGAHLPGELQTRLGLEHGWHVTDVLGSTETGGIATRDQPMKPWTPLPRVTVSAPDGVLAVSSPWCDASVIAHDDRVEVRPDGTFQYLGRASELVKIAGKRAHTHAIEAALRAIPGVDDVAVIVHAPAGREPRVAAAVVASGPLVTREQIAIAVRDQFDPVFAPRIVKLVPNIPRTDRGKVDADAVRTLLGLDARTTNHIPVRAVSPGRFESNIPEDLVFFRGHFDAFHILPGAVLVERLVWPAAKSELAANTVLRGIRRLRFRQPVFPGQQLTVNLKHAPGRVTFEVTRATAVVASGQLLVE